MSLEQIEALADKVSAAMGDYVARAFAAMQKRNEKLEEHIRFLTLRVDAAEAEAKKVEGLEKTIVANTDAYMKNLAEVYECLPAEIAKQIAEPIPGKDGKDADPVDFDAMVKTVVAAIPVPKDGKDAEVDYDRIGKAIEEVVAAIPVPKDGRDGVSVDSEVVAQMVDDAVTKAVDAIPRPRDGVDAVSIPGQDGQDGEPGPPGRDALEIDWLDGIDEKRSYPRNTYAHHRGGSIRAVRTTEPVTDGLIKAGWAIVADGDAQTDIEQGDDLRTFIFGVEKTSGKVFSKQFVFPAMIYRGVFKAGTDYERGDVATWDGSAWHCEQATKAEPGNSKEWKLIAKRGANGKDGTSVKGDAGESGRPGRDLTHMDTDGRKYS